MQGKPVQIRRGPATVKEKKVLVTPLGQWSWEGENRRKRDQVAQHS